MDDSIGHRVVITHNGTDTNKQYKNKSIGYLSGDNNQILLHVCHFFLSRNYLVYLTVDTPIFATNAFTSNFRLHPL